MHLTAHFRGPTTGWMSARHQLVGFNPNSCLYVRFYICALSENMVRSRNVKCFVYTHLRRKSMSVTETSCLCGTTVRLKPSAH